MSLLSSQLKKFCPYCGRDVEADYPICPYCGKELPKPQAAATAATSSFERHAASTFDARQHYTSMLDNIARRFSNGRSTTPASSSPSPAAGAKNMGSSPQARQGLILTNCEKLGIKFFNDKVISARDRDGEVKQYPSAEIIRNYLNQYIEGLAAADIHYQLLDVSHPSFAQLLPPGQTHTWRQYLNLLDVVCQQTPSLASYQTGLFIIGGQDVVPMATVNNPCYDGEKEDAGTHYLEHDLDTDLVYSYASAYVQVDAEGNLNPEPLIIHTPRFSVGRYPLEDGLLEESRLEDFLSYLKRSLHEYLPSAQKKEPGIRVQTNMTTICESTLMVSDLMMEGLPLFSLPSIQGISGKDRLISPRHNLELGATLEETMENSGQGGVLLLKGIQEADMLTFILHGSHVPSARGYYGEDAKKTCNTLAFDPALYAKSKAPVVISLSCWGGRFINYRPENSSVLTALSHKALLFLGASRSAYGIFDPHMDPKHPFIICGEVLVREFERHLLSGQPAGLAMLNARRMSIMSGMFAYDFCTMLEYNLFGDPLLSVQPAIAPVCGVSQLEDYGMDVEEAEVQKMNFAAGGETTDNAKMSLLDRLRNFNDRNLADIRDRVNRLVYQQLNIEPRQLQSIRSIHKKDNAQACEYLFRYETGKNDHSRQTLVRTDVKGNINLIFGSI